MQQANALHVRRNQSLGSLAFLLDTREPRIGLLELFLQGDCVFRSCTCHLRF